MYNHFTDGEYCISVSTTDNRQGTSIYCHGMSTCSPSEYLTLPAGPDNNYSQTYKDSCPSGLVEFEKIGLNLANLNSIMVNSWDWTFAQIREVHEWREDCDAFPLYGRAFSCTCTSGQTSIDLTGTGFHIPSDVTWQQSGNSVVMNNQQRTAQTFYTECRGNCGGCNPQDNAIAASTYYSTEHTDKVMPIQYDASYELNTCTVG